jgi:ubiquinone/menaquinone biosynthesis C-methylase UbiE
MRADRFEGLYGRLYTKVIQTPALRRVAFSLWGSADPLLHLEEIVHAAATETGAGTILDVPCGGGTVLALLAHTRFRGTVIESDLADAMIQRSRTARHRLQPDYTVEFLQTDARTLPIQTATIDTIISINGLHVIPEPQRFVAELARVTRPGGSLWLITPVTSTAVRSRVILAAARALRITPAAPPTLPQLHEILDAHGFRIRRSLGGTNITGIVCDRP